MARGGDLPSLFSRVDRSSSPVAAVAAAAILVGILVLVRSVVTLLAISAFAILVYYSLRSALERVVKRNGDEKGEWGWDGEGGEAGAEEIREEQASKPARAGGAGFFRGGEPGVVSLHPSIVGPASSWKLWSRSLPPPAPSRGT